MIYPPKQVRLELDLVFSEQDIEVLEERLKKYFELRKNIFDDFGGAFTYCRTIGESHLVISTYPEKYKTVVEIETCKESVNLIDLGKEIISLFGKGRFLNAC